MGAYNITKFKKKKRPAVASCVFMHAQTHSNTHVLIYLYMYISTYIININTTLSKSTPNLLLSATVDRQLSQTLFIVHF